ncbi:hypothetical protein JTB14_004074 [Gonioctena quinquepunctata]|nr:hypothetical protein JTB14_004074 [Gonioctena quinquepunctata]
MAANKRVMENMKAVNRMYSCDNSVDFPLALFLQASSEIFKKHWTEYYTEQRKAGIDICNDKIIQYKKSLNMPEHEGLKGKDPPVDKNKYQFQSPRKTGKQQKGQLLERLKLANQYEALSSQRTAEEDTEDIEKTKPGRPKKKPIKQTETKTNKTMPPIVVDNITPFDKQIQETWKQTEECPVYIRIVEQHEAKIANSRKANDQPRFIDAPHPAENAWTNRQSGPRVISRTPQAEQGGSREASRRPPEQAQSHGIQATQGSPKLPFENPSHPRPYMSGMESHLEPPNRKAPDKKPPSRGREKDGKMDETLNPGSSEALEVIGRIRSDSARSSGSSRSSSAENRKRTNSRIYQVFHIPKRQITSGNSQSTSDYESDTSRPTKDKVEKVKIKKNVTENPKTQIVSDNIFQAKMDDKQCDSTPEQSPPLKKHKQSDKEEDEKAGIILQHLETDSSLPPLVDDDEKQEPILPPPEMEEDYRTVTPPPPVEAQVTGVHTTSDDEFQTLANQRYKSEFNERRLKGYHLMLKRNFQPQAQTKSGLTSFKVLEQRALHRVRYSKQLNLYNGSRQVRRRIGRRRDRKPLVPATNLISWICTICGTKQDTPMKINEMKADVISLELYQRMQAQRRSQKDKESNYQGNNSLDTPSDRDGRPPVSVTSDVNNGDNRHTTPSDGDGRPPVSVTPEEYTHQYTQEDTQDTQEDVQ